MKQQELRVVEGREGPREAGRGSIVNLGSANSFVAAPAITQYTATKHAIMGIVKNAGEMLSILGAQTRCSGLATLLTDNSAHQP